MANNELENMSLGDLDGEEKHPNRRGWVPQDNVPVPPPPPQPQAVQHRIFPNEGYASVIVPPRIRAGNFQIHM